MTPKQRAAQAAMAYLSSGMTIGLGTGSTADFFLQALASAVRNRKLTDIRGVPTSRMSERRARELDIPLVSLADVPLLDLTVDGADEIDPRLNLIKGLGGALLREKIVAQNSRQLIVIADAGKHVQTLGTQAPLPVEVTPFAYEAQEAFLRGLGCVPLLRREDNGKPFITDNANYIYDCRFPSIPDPVGLDTALGQRAGIVECGLFLNLAHIALIADDNDVRTLKRSS